ncbi:hypothetical protein [Phreatobacter sp.]|uniref:hypothetical protein n=1 Tax=Phreatobacter sp. TaxID=1966341 RepID=UPI003F705CA4
MTGNNRGEGKQRRRLAKPKVRVDAPAATPQRKRSALLSPIGIGTAALLGVGAITATNGFGTGRTRTDCTTTQIVTTQMQCEAVVPGEQCRVAFSGAPAAVGLSRSGSGSWSMQPLGMSTPGRYITATGQVFSARRSCPTTRSSNSFFWTGGRGGSARSVGWGSSSGRSATQSQGVTRSGFGSTGRSFSSSSSRSGG